MDMTNIDAIIDRYDSAPSALLAIMQDVQDAERYLPREAMDRIAEKLEVPIGRVYQMATFFESFHLDPRGKHVCTVCMGTACHVRGAQRLVEQLERRRKGTAKGDGERGRFYKVVESGQKLG